MVATALEAADLRDAHQGELAYIERNVQALLRRIGGLAVSGWARPRWWPWPPAPTVLGTHRSNTLAVAAAGAATSLGMPSTSATRRHHARPRPPRKLS